MRPTRLVVALTAAATMLIAAPGVAALPGGSAAPSPAGSADVPTAQLTSHSEALADELVERALAADEDLTAGEAQRLAAALVENASLYAESDAFTTQAANPVATDEVTYQAYARVFSDPHGCFVHGDELPPEGAPISPWAKGMGCQLDYLTYEETIEGVKFLERRFPELIQLIRLDQAYDDPGMRSAGIPRVGAIEGAGDLHLYGRDRSPLYLVKVTDRTSQVPEEDRLHFVVSGAIHGDERAGHEGGIRAVEDLVTWATCERDDERAADTPACDLEGVGEDGQPIVESETDRPVPTAGEVLENTVVYYMMPNPDGWRAGQKRTATEFRDGNLNVNYRPGLSFWRHNAHGVDLNRDWPSIGYTLRSHQPLSEPESRAYHDVLSDIRDRTSAGHFAAGIDLHGMLTASAFSYTLLGADQRDYRKNEITVETSLRTYEDQTARLTWSPYIGDSTGDGEQDQPVAIIPVADEWGTIYDTIGYTVTGALGFWMDDSRIGLGGVGINNEMALSNIVPNSIYEPALNQTHIDGNKGLIYSQIAALMFEEAVSFEPTGRVGYVHDDSVRIVDEGVERETNPGLPAQNDIDVFLPCQGELQQQLPGNCGPGEFTSGGATMSYTFEVHGPDRGVWNGGLTVRSTNPQQDGGPLHLHAGVTLERFDEDDGEWVVAKDLNRTNVTYNDPEPGLWRASFETLPHSPRRLEIQFDRHTAEAHPGQLPIDASNLDFFVELNDYVPAGSELEAVPVAAVVDGDGLGAYDTLIVTNDLGVAGHLADEVGLDDAELAAYFDALRAFAEGGGNLVLTDGALHALVDIGLVEPDAVVQDGGLAGFYGFRTAPDDLTYTDPETYPLADGVDLPGAAEATEGNRQAVEPTPLGYSPSGASHAQMPFWGVDRGAWEALCERDVPTHCTTATTTQDGDLTNLGEVTLGDGVVRIAGTLLPNPLRQEDETADNRFGLASYAITYTSYIVFENLIDWAREAEDADPEPTATSLTYTGDTRAQGNTVALAAVLETVHLEPIADRELTFTLGKETYTATTGDDGEARTEATVPGGREHTVTVTFAGDDEFEPAETQATITRGNQGAGGPPGGGPGGAVAQATAPASGAVAGLALLVALAALVAGIGTRRLTTRR